MQLVPPLMLAAAFLLVASPSQGADASTAGDKNDAPRLILQGRRYLEFGKTNEAEAQWLAALKLDPANTYARQYLAAIGRTNIPTEKPEPPAAPNRVHTSEGRQKIYAKLDTIRFDSVAYDSLPLSAVIKAIDKDTVNRDPEQKGVNFLLSSTADPLPTAAPAIDPQTGLPVASVVTPENEVESTSITISPPQRDITLHQLLDILVLVADRPIKYSVTDFGVVITRRVEDTLYTRWYKIDPNTFLNGLQGVVNQRFGSQQTGNASGSAQAAGVSIVPAAVGQNPGPGSRQSGRQAQGGIDYTEIQTSQDAYLGGIKHGLHQLGVDLTKPPKSAVYNDRLGMLMIRGTLADLQTLDQIINRGQSMAPKPGIEGTISTPTNSAPPRIPH